MNSLLKFPFNVKYWKFLHRQNKFFVSQRKRIAWFCLLSFLTAAGLWRLSQETALISGIDWKDTGSATNSHVTLGKSLPPPWVALFINRGIFITRPKEFWGSSTGSCFPSPGGCLVHLENGNWHGFQSLSLPSVSLKCVALYTQLQSRGWVPGISRMLQEMDEGPTLSSQLKDSGLQHCAWPWVFHKLHWAEYCLMFVGPVY